MRQLALVAREADEGQHLAHRGRDCPIGLTLHAEAIGHVLEDAQMREEGVALKDEADIPFVGHEARHVLAADEDAAGVGLLEARDHPEGRGLAAAGRTEEREELGGPDLQAQLTDGIDLAPHAVVEALGHAVEPDGDGIDHLSPRLTGPLASGSEPASARRASALASPGPSPPARSPRQLENQPLRMLVTWRLPADWRRRSAQLTPAMTTNTMATTSTEKAAAGPRASSVMFSRMRTVMRVQLMETRKMVALIAVMERMKTTPSPAKKAGTMRGSVTRLKVVPLRAPSPCEASSMLGSICWSRATVARMPVGL